MSANAAKTRLPILALILLLGSMSASSQQTVQTRQSDVDFTSRLMSETDRMQSQVRELSARVSAMEAPVAVDLDARDSGTATAASGVRTAETLRHRDRAANAEEFEDLKAKLGSIDYKIVQEQRRLNAADPADAERQTASVNNLRSLADELQQLDEVVSGMESTNRYSQ